MFKLFLLISVLGISFTKASRVLICVPCPSLSHQVIFYPIITELLKRNHEVIFITTDPMYPDGNSPENLTEVNTHDISYKAWREQVLIGTTTGSKSDGYLQVSKMIPAIGESFKLQMQTPQVQDLIKNKTKIDLLIVEGVSRSAQALSHVFKAPMILVNSLGGLQVNYEVMGAPIYPKLLYPIYWHQKLTNLSILDKMRVLWDTYWVEYIYDVYLIQENKNVKQLFGSDTPSLEELGNNVDMLFLNVYPLWDHNRPVPPGVVYIAGIHQKPQKNLPKDLKAYLDSSERGVVYFSMGTNVNPSTLPAEKIQILMNGLAKLKYDILVKWDFEHLPSKGNNTKVAKWLPQSDLLRHPNIKAFVTQGGLQSFDEALTAGVPLVGIPMLADQWYNVDRYASLKIGVALLMEELTENMMSDAVTTVVEDPSYRQNMVNLRSRLRDQPESALQRAVWWAEHVMRHGGGAHLRAPAANMAWTEFLDLQLWLTISLLAFTALMFTTTLLYLLLRQMSKTFGFAKHKLD